MSEFNCVYRFKVFCLVRVNQISGTLCLPVEKSWEKFVLLRNCRRRFHNPRESCDTVKKNNKFLQHQIKDNFWTTC